MEPRYVRNQIHISNSAQQRYKDFSILIAGCGIGSYIAECLLRMGFENLTIVDGDYVELTNLNRQNYVEADIGMNKALVLQRRLLAINPQANITAIPRFITVDNLYEFDMEYSVSVNALDFDSDIPFLFDETCCQAGIPVIHPYNLGWAGFVTVLTSDSRSIQSLEREHKVFEMNVGQFILDSLEKQSVSTDWFENFLKEYGQVALTSPPPQLSIGVNILSGMVAHIVSDIATDKTVKKFPESYYLSIA